MIESILNILFKITVSSSLLILALLALRRILRRRISPRLQYAIWALVLIRLLLPFSLPSPSSVMNLFEKMPVQAEQQTPRLTQASHVANVLGPNYTGIKISPAITVKKSHVAPESKTSITIILVFVWISGIIAVFGFMVYSNIRFIRKIHKTSSYLPEVQCILPVYVMDGLPSPCLMGIIHPKIIVTPKAMRNPEILKSVLAHELCHFRQKDNWIALLRNICCAVYWFNPLVWYAAAVSKDDCEMSCDSRVLGKLSEDERITYGEALLTLMRREKIPAGVLNASTAMTASKSKMRERISMIMKQNKANKLTVVFVIAMLVVVSAFTMTGALNKDSNNGDKSSKAEVVKQTDKNKYIKLNIPGTLVNPEKTLVNYFKTIGYNARLIKKDDNVMRSNQKGLVLIFDLGKGTQFYATLFRVQGKSTDTWEIINYSFTNPNDELLAALIELKLDEIIQGQKSADSVHNKEALKADKIDEIVKYGEPAYNYMISQFAKGKGKGLRGDLMAEACVRILGYRNNVPKGWKTGEEWYSKLKPLKISALPPVKKPKGWTVEDLAVTAALGKYKPYNKNGVVLAAAQVYGIYEKGNTLTIWATVYYQEFLLYGKKLAVSSAGDVPAAIKLQKKSNGSYALIQYTEAKDGGLFAPSIREFCKEKPGVAEKIINGYGHDKDLSGKLLRNLVSYLKENNLKGIYLEDFEGKCTQLT